MDEASKRGRGGREMIDRCELFPSSGWSPPVDSDLSFRVGHAKYWPSGLAPLPSRDEPTWLPAGGEVGREPTHLPLSSNRGVGRTVLGASSRGQTATGCTSPCRSRLDSVRKANAPLPSENHASLASKCQSPRRVRQRRGQRDETTTFDSRTLHWRAPPVTPIFGSVGGHRGG